MSSDRVYFVANCALNFETIMTKQLIELDNKHVNQTSVIHLRDVGNTWWHHVQSTKVLMCSSRSMDPSHFLKDDIFQLYGRGVSMIPLVNECRGWDKLAVSTQKVNILEWPYNYFLGSFSLLSSSSGLVCSLPHLGILSLGGIQIFNTFCF